MASGMNKKPVLSIVTPTIGDFSEYWFEQLLNVKGDVEFVLVYPPELTPKAVSDSRVKILISPYKGEVIQRLIGLLNASGRYVLALDDDDFVHPDVVELTTKYFNRFPRVWALRLRQESIGFQDEERIKRNWEGIPDVHQLEICKKTEKNPYPFKGGKYTGLLEIPIAPLNNKFDICLALWPFAERRDQHGIHAENFNNIVWKNDLVQKALSDFSRVMKIFGPLIWLPRWTLDRSLGLFIQAKSFKENIIIGHLMPKPEQIRKIEKPSCFRSKRFHIAADILLVKRFPQYGYLWNLIFSQLWAIPIRGIRFLRRKLSIK